ncbi:MAG: hypothetical protein GC168_20495 [Candidatus Hydrogenedens sp.]|nr:hypothetical protein [Candidatus Hydrogenedens sp.]
MILADAIDDAVDRSGTERTLEERLARRGFFATGARTEIQFCRTIRCPHCGHDMGEDPVPDDGIDEVMTCGGCGRANALSCGPEGELSLLALETKADRAYRAWAKAVGVARIAAVICLPLWAPSPAPARADTTPGPVEARVLDVVDGDTFRVRARLWPGLTAETLIRIEGIDAPELHGRCPAETQRAEAAQRRLKALLGHLVTLTRIKPDKYGDRKRAHVTAQDGTDVGAAMIAAGLARPYRGGRRKSWCDGDGQ